MAKMSGRGLGYTGGTLDKLEAIPGFQIELSDEAFVRIVNESKVAVIGQSGNLAPHGQNCTLCVTSQRPLILFR